MPFIYTGCGPIIECQLRIIGDQLRSLSGDLLLQRLGEQPDDKLHKRLYNAIRTSILDGSLPPSSRLPASRDLAQELSLSRNTVLTVYEQLLAEGYVSARAGSGTSSPTRCRTAASPPAAPRRTAVGNRTASNCRARHRLLHHASASPKQWGHSFPACPTSTPSPSAVQQDSGAPQPPPGAATADLQQSGR